MVRKQIQVKGIVQGVGFRPYVYKKALEYSLSGRVKNSSSGVLIDVEGPLPQLAAFEKELLENPPPLAQISEITACEKEICGYTNFQIVPSVEHTGKEALVPPDVALCPDCKRDIFTPHDRHYLYPFTNCTNCGPRFTIVKNIPYDRPQTTMGAFQMCHFCKTDYDNPLDRRFHAQPVACPECGPNVVLTATGGKPAALLDGDVFATVRSLLLAGKIIAVKSLGGFHLACDAKNPVAVSELRKRKKRPFKPFAVMARDINTVKQYCRVTPEEETVLNGPVSPIVILNRHKEELLPENLAPGIATLGVMVPYTPLHFLLFDGETDLLVMTSGNISNLPLVGKNEGALRQLRPVADFFLMHNRDIYNRCDDSLVRVIDGKARYWRRSRGAVPAAVSVPHTTAEQIEGAKETAVLGTGGEMKNAFCLLKKGRAYLSQHIGELDSLEGMEHFLESLQHFASLIDVSPTILGYDMHPHYSLTRLAHELPPAEKFPVQHHHAHMAACMAENGLDEQVLGAVLDGTGYGPDGNLWGFEILTGDYNGFTRHAHLAYVPLPGGDKAIKNPWLTAVSYLICHVPRGRELAERVFPGKKREIELTANMLERKFNSPLSSGCGRLFDAFSALLDICLSNTYEGQAAIELGEYATHQTDESYSFGTQITTDPQRPSRTKYILLPGPVFQSALQDLEKGITKNEVATKFHNTVINMVVTGIERASLENGLKKVVLSGGTWQNEVLLKNTANKLREKGFSVYDHSRVPANDGGLALGQAMVAYRRWQRNVLGGSR